MAVGFRSRRCASDLIVVRSKDRTILRWMIRKRVWVDCASVFMWIVYLCAISASSFALHFDFRFIEIVNIGNPIIRNTLNYGKQANERTNEPTNQPTNKCYASIRRVHHVLTILKAFILQGVKMSWNKSGTFLQSSSLSPHLLLYSTPLSHRKNIEQHSHCFHRKVCIE